MKRITICFLWVMSLIISCKDKKAPGGYENNLGIKPAVIAQIDTANYTKISWEDTAKNFGIVKEGENVFLKYKFTNSGNKPLFISGVYPACGCTVVDFSQNAIMPGKGGEVTANFNSMGHPGFIHKTITVVSNSSNRVRQILLLNGEVMDSLKYSKYKK